MLLISVLMLHCVQAPVWVQAGLCGQRGVGWLQGRVPGQVQEPGEQQWSVVMVTCYNISSAGHLSQGQGGQPLLPVCGILHRGRLWDQVRVCLHCRRWENEIKQKCTIINCFPYWWNSRHCWSHHLPDPARAPGLDDLCQGHQAQETREGEKFKSCKVIARTPKRIMVGRLKNWINPSIYPQVGLGPGAEMAHGNAPNFYYGAPAPYAESIAPSHHRSVMIIMIKCQDLSLLIGSKLKGYSIEWNPIFARTILNRFLDAFSYNIRCIIFTKKWT